jgi:hypothetical protein
MGIPDLKYINRSIPIAGIAQALDLKFGLNGNIHCWRGELHKNGDRTASVGIRNVNNTVKCFGCGLGPFGPADLVRSVLDIESVGDAARWISERFHVPELPRGKHLDQPARRRFQFGTESAIGLLVHSGLWARLKPGTRALAPVLLEFADREQGKQVYHLQISYLAIRRYSGISSPNSIKAGLRELESIHWLPNRRFILSPTKKPSTRSEHRLSP